MSNGGTPLIETANKAAIEGSIAALRMVVTINGGAAVAMLAFIGGVVGQGKLDFGPELTGLASTLVWFAIGVAMGTLALAGAYFTNLSIVRHQHTPLPHWQWIAETFRWVTVVLGLGALALFVCGVFDVRSEITKLM